MFGSGLRRIVQKKWDRAVVNWHAWQEQDRNARRGLREKLLQERHARRLAASRWGGAYSVFNGEELLEASLRSIRAEVDYIVLVYQTQSWYGVPAAETLLPFLESLRAAGLADELVEYQVDLKLKPKNNEFAKRNLGLEYVRRNGCDYFMGLDCDEFFIASEMAFGKAFIVENYITHSYVPVLCYGEKPTQVLLDAPGTSYAPFFGEVHSGPQMQPNTHIPCRVEPSKKMQHFFGARYWVFDREVQMHHMSYIRKNLQHKIDNAAFQNGKVKAPRPDFATLRLYEQPDIFGVGDI